MRDWMERNIISTQDLRAIGFALGGIGAVLLLLALFTELWQIGLPGVALLLLGGYVYVVRHY